MGGGTKQEQVPKLITDLLTNAAAYYLFGNTLPMFHKRDINFPALQGGGGGSPGGSAAPGQPGSVNQYTNPLSLLPSGQMGAGNIPGSILPNFGALLQLSGRNFFGGLSPNAMNINPIQRTGLNNLASPIFPNMGA